MPTNTRTRSSANTPWPEARARAVALLERAQQSRDLGETARLAVRARDALRGHGAAHEVARYATRHLAHLRGVRGRRSGRDRLRELEALLRLLATVERPEQCSRARLRLCWPPDDWDGTPLPRPQVEAATG